MTTVDYLIIAAIVLSTAFGTMRGFLRESVALLGWLLGLWLAWKYASQLQPYLGGALQGTLLQVWVARIILLLAAVLAARLLAGLIGYLVERSGLTLGVDRVLGAVFGLVRGGVIVGFVVMMGQAAELEGEGWWQESRLMRLGEEMAAVLREYVETGNEFVNHKASET
ncbi:MAG TPA: CvpA family protein [Steroidobacteraceae bacterium]|nr:CvpA family protein [Steroidobacteraceae bacterium]